jgi:hypothetical protein
LANRSAIINATTSMTIRNNTNVSFTEIPVYLDGSTTNLTNNGETLYGNYALFIRTLVGTPTNYLGSGLSTLGYYDAEKNIHIFINGINLTSIYGGTNTLTTSGSTGFAGIQYRSDYSGNNKSFIS